MTSILLEVHESLDVLKGLKRLKEIHKNKLVGSGVRGKFGQNYTKAGISDLFGLVCTQPLRPTVDFFFNTFSFGGIQPFSTSTTDS